MGDSPAQEYGGLTVSYDLTPASERGVAMHHIWVKYTVKYLTRYCPEALDNFMAWATQHGWV